MDLSLEGECIDRGISVFVIVDIAIDVLACLGPLLTFVGPRTKSLVMILSLIGLPRSMKPDIDIIRGEDFW